MPVTTVLADGIEPGLWKVTTRVESGGVIGPPRETRTCLTPEQTRDLAATFSPISRTINSECAPIERSLVNNRLKWQLVCKGQIDMELTGDFVFEPPHRYSATIQTKATMPGSPTVASRNVLEAERISQCE